METQTLNFTGHHAIKRGTTRRILLQFEQVDGSPIALTNVSAIARLSRSAGATVITQFTVTFIDRAEGVLEISLSAAQTEALQKGCYFWELFLTLANGDLVCPLQGTLEIMERIL